MEPRLVDRRNNFDFIRLVAASLVLVSHSYALTGDGGFEPLGRLTGGRFTMGGLSVRVFFVVSGLLVTQSWLRRPTIGAFVSARALRILPALALALLYGVAIGAATGTLPVGEYLSSSETWRYLWRNLTLRTEFFLPGVFEGNIYPRAVNGSLWSLAYEVRAYLVVLALGVAGLLRRRWTACLGWIAAAALLWLWPKGWGLSATSDVPVLNAFLCFVLGALLAPHPALMRHAPWATLALALLVPVASGHAWIEFLVDALLCAAVMWIAHLRVPLLQNAGRYGDLSYGIFIFAFPTQQLIALGKLTDHRPWFLSALALPATMALAFASWHLVERPAMSLKGPVAGLAGQAWAAARGAAMALVRAVRVRWLGGATPER